jgi:hypothetical protein
VANLIGTTLSRNFTWPATFGRRHHSPPYNIFCASPQGLHPNVIFPQDSQVGIPKLGLLLSQNFGRSYLSQFKSILRVRGHYLIALENIFPTMYSTFIPNFTHTSSFDPNSCKLGPNDQCEGILSIYASRPFQWYPEGLIWCFSPF